MIVLMAKAPEPGRVKTRLCPPLRPEEAAELSRAALADTIAAVEGCGLELVVALDGPLGDWCPPGTRVIEQRGDGLGERLAHAFADVGSAAIAIAMDTPHVTPSLLRGAWEALGTEGIDAVLGPAVDGGYWAIGLRRPDPAVFDGVPMSRSDTGRRQLERLQALGLAVAIQPELCDVDDIASARRVAAEAPETRFARRFRALAR